MPSGLLRLLLPVVLSLYLLHLTQKYNSMISVYRREVTPGTAIPCPDGRQESVNVWGTHGEGLYSSMLGHGLHFLPAPRKLSKTLGTLCWRNAQSVSVGLLALKFYFTAFCFHRLRYCSEQLPLQLLPTIPSLLPLLQKSRAKLCINCCSPDSFERCQSPLVLCEQGRFQYT